MPGVATPASQHGVTSETPDRQVIQKQYYDQHTGALPGLAPKQLVTILKPRNQEWQPAVNPYILYFDYNSITIERKCEHDYKLLFWSFVFGTQSALKLTDNQNQVFMELPFIETIVIT